MRNIDLGDNKTDVDTCDLKTEEIRKKPCMEVKFAAYQLNQW